MDYSFIEPSGRAGNFKRCFAFSVHKCGSTLMHSMIKMACRHANVSCCDIPGPIFNKGIGPSWQNDPDICQLIADGHIYVGFRNFPPVLASEVTSPGVKSVLLVRDPRDALVSQYYSLMPGGSHALPKENATAFIETRKHHEGLSIDEYALRNASNLRRKLEEYKSNLDFSQTKLFKYENIFFNKKEFLKDIFDYYGVEVEGAIIDAVADEHDIVPEKEDPTKHIRKGLPGDHAEKLSSPVIEELNSVFGEIGEFFGYSFG